MDADAVHPLATADTTCYAGESAEEVARAREGGDRNPTVNEYRRGAALRRDPPEAQALPPAVHATLTSRQARWRQFSRADPHENASRLRQGPL